MRKDTMERLIREYKGDYLADYLTDHIALETRLRQRLHVLQKLTRDEDGRHNDVLKSLAKERMAIQKDCPHHEMTAHGDPAGGPSYCDCDLCGFTR